MSSDPNRSELRARIREARRLLSDAERQVAELRIAQRVLELGVFGTAQHIALYLASDGELSVQTIAERAWAAAKQTYLPILCPGKTLKFASYTPETALESNRFGIFEPVTAQATCRSPAELDLVITPLVAFDAGCARLGMGGGYYDRSFAFLQNNLNTSSPVLVGVAFELQRVAHLEQCPWDVPLAAVVSERALYGG